MDIVKLGFTETYIDYCKRMVSCSPRAANLSRHSCSCGPRHFRSSIFGGHLPHHVEVRILNFPQAHFKRKRFGETDGILQSGELIEIAEILAPISSERFELAAEPKFEAGVIEGDIHTFGFADQSLNGVDVEGIFVEGAANIGVEGEFGGDLEACTGGRPRSTTKRMSGARFS